MSWAVFSAALSAASAACSQAGRSGCRRRRPGSGRRANGTRTSTRVLSPTVALPKSIMRRAESRDGGGDSRRCAGRRRHRERSPTARRMMPHSAPEVPPALSAQASPAWCRTVAAPAPRSTACFAAGVDRRRATRAACRCRGRRRRRWRRSGRVRRRCRPSRLDRASSAVRTRRGGLRGIPRWHPADRWPRRRRGSRWRRRLRRRRGDCPCGRPGCRPARPSSRSSSSSSQKRVRDSPAMSKLVTSSPTSGSTTSMPGVGEQFGDGAVDHEQFLVLDACPGR